MDILRAVNKNTTETEANNNSISQHNINLFAEIADKYGDSVYKFCRGLTYSYSNSKNDADDLFQETFLKVFEQPDKINGSDNPQGFLFSAALYVWKSWKRKYARRNRIAPFVELLDETNNMSISVEDDYITREEIRQTRALVESLPEKYKIPVILYYSMEMSVSDIAKTLKLPDGTVKSRLFKARKIIEKGLI